MQINSVNNVSFSARNPEQKAIKKANKEQYYKYLSQVNANDALKMSVGREVEDAKLKLEEKAGNIFLTFVNVDTGKVNVLFKLKDSDNFGIVEPEV